MPADVINEWFRSGKPAQVIGKRLRPIRHALLGDSPVSIRRGQAEVFFLASEDGAEWLLKKFHQSMQLDAKYLRVVSAVLPQHEGLRSGTQRHVLETGDLDDAPGCYFCPTLRDWLSESVLMPRVSGSDWASVADDVRGGSLVLDDMQRRKLCRSLIGLIQILEQSSCSHRDLSASNVFVDPTTQAVSLIDFDSSYHSTFSMPSRTSCGTEGYIPPFAWRDGSLDPRTTWCIRADRYALTLLNVEFLTLERGIPLASEGGMFLQEELRAGQGQSLMSARSLLQTGCPGAVSLFDAAIRASSVDQCPGPDDWAAVVGNGHAYWSPTLADMPTLCHTDFAGAARRRNGRINAPKAPALAELPVVQFSIREPPPVVVPLIADPWKQ